MARNSTEASAPSWEAGLWPLPAPDTHPIALDAHVSFEAREAVFTLQGNQREPQSGGENPCPAHPPHGQCWVRILECPAPALGSCVPVNPLPSAVLTGSQQEGCSPGGLASLRPPGLAL